VRDGKRKRGREGGRQGGSDREADMHTSVYRVAKSDQKPYVAGHFLPKSH